MNKCPKCGSYIPEGGKMCIACGWRANADRSIKDDPNVEYFQSVINSIASKLPKDANGNVDLPHDETGWIAAASYLGPAFLYTYFVKGKDSELVRYHANQACLLFFAKLLSAAFYKNKIPLIGGALKSATDIMLFVLAFMGARTAVAREKKPVPVLGELNITILK